MNPTGLSQQTQQSGYNQTNNPTTQNVSEQTIAATTSSSPSSSPSSTAIDRRQPHDLPSTHSGAATASALGRGSRGPLEEKPILASDAQNYSSNSQLEGEQMRAPGEGDVADAVTEKKFGGHGEQAGLMEDLDRRIQGHREALHERGMRTGSENQAGKGNTGGTVMSNAIRRTADGGEVDLGEALGGRGGGVVLAPES